MSNIKRDLEPASVWDNFEYNPLTGQLFWKTGRHWKGKVAGRAHPNGYRSVTINRKHYQLHRVIWLFVTGKHPEGVVDHIDGVRDNNVWGNLRDVSQSTNCLNRKVKPKGVYQAPSGNWFARIKVNYKVISLGTFSTREEALNARHKYETENLCQQTVRQ